VILTSLKRLIRKNESITLLAEHFMSRHVSLLVWGVVFLNGTAQAAPPEPKTEPKSEPTWEEVAKEQKLDEKQITILRNQKFVVSNKPEKQIFSAYLGGNVPYFITSDSIMNGYHVLFEESIYRLELANAKKLPGVLERVAKNLDKATEHFKGDAELIKASKKRAAIFIGVARNLLAEQTLPADPDVRTVVEDEVKWVLASVGTRKHRWLGPPDTGFQAIDYSRFKPRGFYEKSAALQRYFRAAAWLQAIPFRLEKDEEFAAFMLMRHAYFESKEEQSAAYNLWAAYRSFLGEHDDWDLSRAFDVPAELTKAGLDKVRETYRGRAVRDGGPRINDQLRFAPMEPDGKLELSFRFLAPFRLPDGVMFQRTMTSPGVEKRDFPSGLEVAAVLGSPFARTRLERESPKLLNSIDASRTLFGGESLYAEYLRCLGVLLARTEPDAPEFMKLDAWKAKTCQTALAGWAQLRHTWALQAKQSVMYLSAFRENAGFVEPVPEFYGNFARLIDNTRQALEHTGAFSEAAGQASEELAADLERAIRLVKSAREKKLDVGMLSIEELDLLSRFYHDLNAELDVPAKERDSAKILDRIAAFLVECEKLLGPDDRANQKLARMIGLDTQPLSENWDRLSKLCHRLELLAHKQLRQVPFNADENKFIRDYGKDLAGIMFYGGNSYSSPRDDAMRVIDVFSVFSDAGTGRHLHIGITRPRELWVLYPMKDGEVLCRGAVMPYAEFTHTTRLNDHEWKSLMDSPKRPEVPRWAQSVIPPEATRR
jgi:hypothetical protein